MNQTTIQAKSYKKKCKTCSTEIVMSNESGKWRALETDGSTTHVCQLNERPPQRPSLTTEKTPMENFQILRFDVDVMELQKAMIAAIKELSHSQLTKR